MNTHQPKLKPFIPLLSSKYTKPSMPLNPSTKLPLNKLPLPKLSHRAMPAIYISKPRTLSIQEHQQKLRKLFSAANLDQRALTTKILGQRENNTDVIIENQDSFNDRYSPTKHTFFHQAIGEVQLPRKFFNNANYEKFFRYRTQENFSKGFRSSQMLYKTIKNSFKIEPAVLKEIRRKAMTSFEHYRKLRIDSAYIPRLAEYLPGVPYGQPKSEEFLTACKEGNLEKIGAMIEGNKWIVHVFDVAGQTGLHWAVKRQHKQVAAVLLRSGLWVDATDYVGRSPLFIAVKNEDIEMVTFLITHRANGLIKTRAGTAIYDGVKDPTIKSLIIKRAKRHYETFLSTFK